MSESLHIVCPHCSATNRLPESRLSDKPNCGGCKRALFEGHPVELNEISFNKMIQSNDTPVVVDFWASWCGPCKMMAPMFEQAAAKMEPHVRFAKVNTEQEQSLAMRFNIRSIPTVAIFENGTESARQAGAMDANSLTRWIESQINR